MINVGSGQDQVMAKGDGPGPSLGPVPGSEPGPNPGFSIYNPSPPLPRLRTPPHPPQAGRVLLDIDTRQRLGEVEGESGGASHRSETIVRVRTSPYR